MQVVAHHRIPALERNVAQPGRKLPACAVEQAVDLAMPLHDTGHTGFDGIFIADVAGMCADIACALGVDGGYFCRDGLELGRLPAHQGHLRTQAGQFVCSAAPQAAATACDGDGLTIEQPAAKGRLVTRQIGGGRGRQAHGGNGYQ